MTPSRSLPLYFAVVVFLSTTLQSQQQPPDPRPQATFKTGVDIVQLDVSVFDKDRRPIRGLTMEDFSILENGKPQPIVAVVPVDVSEPAAASAGWLRDAPLDAVSNAGENRRLIAIVMDDAGTGVELGESRSARLIANGIVDQMGPDDLASVVFTYLGKPQNWTADRSRLRAAIESFIPKVTAGPPPSSGRGIPSAGALSPSSRDTLGGLAGPPMNCMFRRARSCLVDTLWSVGTVLEDAPPGRKIVMLISSNGALEVMTNPDRISEIQNMFRSLQRVNATVYAFDPRGLTTVPTGQETEDLRSIAAATGGYVFANTNAPEARVPDVFRENGSYYLIGFRPTDTSPDGRFRRVQVKVNRPGAEARTRLGYYAPRTDRTLASNSRKPEAALDAALTGVIPSGALPITLSVAAFAMPGKREAVLTLVSSLTQVRATVGASHHVNLVASVFDLEGKGYGTHRQTIEVKSETDGLTYDVYARIPALKPGRYEVRFAAENAGRAGSVFVGVDVPQFAKEDLALSGVLVERTPLRLVANPGALASVTSVKPTAARTFTRADGVRAFLRVYQKQRRPVRLAARVVNDRNDSVFSHTDDLAGEAFRSGGSADYQVNVPVASLPHGQYLLTIEAVAGDKRAARDLRFAIK